MDASRFKEILPEFATTSEAQIDLFINIGSGLLNVDRWGDSLEYGLALFVGHHLAISNRDQMAAAAGGEAGQVKGVVTGKTVDKISVSYDGALGTYEGAGFWNQTNYGVRFFQLARLIGAGGVQM